MEQAHSTQPGYARGLQAAQAAATLLPAFALGAPGDLGPLAGDLAPEWTAAGLGLLLSIPAGVLLVVRRGASQAPQAGGALWLLLFIAAGAASLALRPAADTLSASRALLTLFTGLLMFQSGASLDASGRAWLARGAVVLTGWLLVPTFTGAVAPAGALGNTGSTSEAALIGAAIGLSFGARGSGVWRWLGAGAALALATYAGWAPAVAGILCLGLAIALSSFLSLSANEGRWRAAGLGLACVFVFGVAWVRTHAPHPDAPAGPAAEEAGLASTTDLLGGEVRLRIWRGTARMIRDYGVLGAGPGQFGAAFPPYRDPGEIALSSAPQLGRETEVEHAHNDWLQGFADAGPGGLAWVLFLLAAAWRALASLRSDELARSALSAATLAVLANALLRSPFSFNPACALMFAVLGATSASDGARTGKLAAKLGLGLGVAALALVLVSIPRALALVTHGRALASVFPGGHEEPLGRALAACPDSPQARALQAQLWKLTGREEDPQRSLANWERVLAVRPHRLVAWMEVGRLHAQAGERARARSAWGRALVLAPGHPIVSRNLARLEASAGDAQAALRWLEAGGDTSPELLRAIASDAVLVGSNVEAALELASRAEPERPALTPQSAWNLAQTLEEREPFRARWLEGAAHLAWAREHRAAGDPATATRSYRQALRKLWFQRPGSQEHFVADALRLEFAATLAAGERPDEARGQIELLRRPDSARLAPEWVRTSLTGAGLLPGP